MLWRPDGRLARDLPPERKMFPLIMRRRNEAAVYYDVNADATKLEPMIAAWNEAHPDAQISPFHVVVWALVETLEIRPNLNRFVAGGRIWDRDGIHISYAVKANLDDDTSPLITVKRRLQAGRPFADTVKLLRGDQASARSSKKGASATEVEMRAMGCLPVVVQRFIYELYRGLDGLGLIPAPLLRGDPLYTSACVANLGSIGLDPVYHHLFEHGTGSVFCVVGKLGDAVVAGQAEPSASGAHVRAPQPVVRRTLPLRFTLDERVCDGLYMQRALQAFQGLVEDPSLALGAGDPGAPA